MADDRLYRAEAGWLATVNEGDARLFCHRIDEGADHYHRIAIGEVYLERGTEKFCLACALAQRILTHQRPTLANAPFADWSDLGPRGDGPAESGDSLRPFVD